MAQGHSPEKPFFDALLAEKNVLWSAIMRCNAFPRMRTEFTSPLAANSFESLKSWLAGSPDSVRTEESEQDVVFFWDFSEDSRKLALLDDDQLSRLAAVVGVALHAPALARIITRKERLACREALGDELFDYALVRGQYQSGEATTIVAQRDLEVPLPERCRRHGWLALYLCSLPWPKELRMAFHRRL
ncbi:MAG: SctK family type III secretion system sorting platform protein, partial [Desulfovibrio sp.]|nr:SctK family type III secretion system sorting platform protein [Desulfovibrio sp.]